MSTLRCRMAASAFVLVSLWGFGETRAQTWVRPGDIIFDTFGDPPDIATESPPRSTQLTGGEFLAPDAPPTLLPSADPDPLIDDARVPGALRFDTPSAGPRTRTNNSATIAQNDEWHVLPGTLLYHSYLAGPKEPRIGLSVLNDSKRGWLWESALGGRVGILRHGDLGLRPANAWQIDLEGAALARVNPVMESAPLEATDYRVGIQWTKRTGPIAYKAGYYHVSAHAGDEFLLLNPGFKRINYVRDSLVFGVTRDVTDDVQVYGELGYALGADGGAEPLEFQFGTQYVPIADTGRRGSPFAAANVQMRQEVDFGGGINIMAGWRWRGVQSGRLLRVGLQYYNGKSIQYEFFDQDQQLLGYGIWYDY